MVLAEDNTLLREGLSRLIEANGDLELTGVATDLPELLALIASDVPDVLVRDEFLVAEGFFGHAAADYAVEMARRSGARRVVLFQHQPDRTDDALDEMLARFDESPRTSIAAESTVVQL